MAKELAWSSASGNLRKPPVASGGHWLFRHGPEAARNPLEFYQRVWREAGDVVKMRAILGFEWYLIVNPAGAERVLQSNQANYRKPKLFTKSLGLIAGNGLVTSEGDFWRRQRRLAQPAFHRQRLAMLAETMVRATEQMLAKWERDFAQTEKAFDISAEMTDLTVQIAAETLFSADISDDSERFSEALKVALEHVSYRMRYPFALPEFVPTKRNRKFLHARRVLDEIVLKIIRERRLNEADRGDLLSMLMLARDEETCETMSDAQLKDEVMTLLIAGHETTASGLAWAWYLLAKNETARRKLKAELDENIMLSPAFSDLPNLKYTRMVFDETLRLFPPAWGQPRESLEADEIGGFLIEPKRFVVVSQYLTHRHPDFWEKAEEFIPERFSPENAEERPKFAYFPFGGGARQCIGNHFALMEAQLILATVAKRFAPVLCENQNPELDPTFALRPKNGIWMRLSA